MRDRAEQVHMHGLRYRCAQWQTLSTTVKGELPLVLQHPDRHTTHLGLVYMDAEVQPPRVCEGRDSLRPGGDLTHPGHCQRHTGGHPLKYSESQVKACVTHGTLQGRGWHGGEACMSMA
jgi:hypothetical protein